MKFYKYLNFYFEINIELETTLSVSKNFLEEKFEDNIIMWCPLYKIC